MSLKPPLKYRKWSLITAISHGNNPKNPNTPNILSKCLVIYSSKEMTSAVDIIKYICRKYKFILFLSNRQPPIRPYKRWVIAVFTETNDYSLVPVNWLISTTLSEITISNITKVQFCRWPPFNVSSTELLEAEDPDNSWNSFKIKIVDGKLYENFKDAFHKRVEIESCVTKDESETQKNLNKKRQKSSSEDNSDFEDNNLSITPIKKTIVKHVPRKIKKTIMFSDLPVRGYDQELSSVTKSAEQIQASTSVSNIHTNGTNKICDSKNKEDFSNTSCLKRVQSKYYNSMVDNSIDLKMTNYSTLNLISENDVVNNLSLIEKLRLLIVKHNVSHNFCNSLLQILTNEGLDVPKDIRTLTSTPKLHDIVVISGGWYIHLGLKNMMLPILIKNNAQTYVKSQVLELGINIDGHLISKSPKCHLWPVLISILNFKELKENVVPIGFFHGFQKPQIVEEFFNPLIIDLLEVLDNGLSVNGLFFKIKISNISCDSTAKAFLLNVKGDNEYFGCTLCMEEGTYLDQRMTYPGLNAQLRTDESFRNKKDKHYHKGDSPLVRLPINITNTVVLDYMHNVCLGVVKQLIEFWVKGDKRVKLEKNKKDKINEELKKLRSYVPSEICRLPRAIDEIEYYKATELRTFLLYTGQIVLKGNLKKKFYFHFLLLVYSIRILICAETCLEYNELATQLLKKFVNDYSNLYGSQFISYNVHSLILLPIYVLIHGSLDNFSCFRYDNFIQEIIRSMKSIKYPLQEILNSVLQKQKICQKLPPQLHDHYPVLSDEIIHKCSSPFFKINDKLFEKISLALKNTVIINVLNDKDRCIMLTNNNLVMVHHIVETQNKATKLIVKRFLSYSEFSTTPLSSFEIGVYIVDTSNMSELYSINLTDIKYKCFFIQLSENWALVSSMCHSES